VAAHRPAYSNSEPCVRAPRTQQWPGTWAPGVVEGLARHDLGRSASTARAGHGAGAAFPGSGRPTLGFHHQKVQGRWQRLRFPAAADQKAIRPRWVRLRQPTGRQTASGDLLGGTAQGPFAGEVACSASSGQLVCLPARAKRFLTTVRTLLSVPPTAFATWRCC